MGLALRLGHPPVRLESLHELRCRSFFVRFRTAGLSPLVLGSTLTSNGCSPRSSGESPCVPGFQLGMCQLHLPTNLPLNSRNHCVWKSGLQAPGSRPQPPNMTHWQYQHPSICRSNRTTLADECTQGFPLCCRIRPDIAVFCIDRTATCPRGSTELALDTLPCPRDLSQSPVFIVAKASSDHHPSILVPQQVPCLTGPGGARSRS